jgi:hypothetical protein
MAAEVDAGSPEGAGPVPEFLLRIDTLRRPERIIEVFENIGCRVVIHPDGLFVSIFPPAAPEARSSNRTNL